MTLVARWRLASADAGEKRVPWYKRGRTLQRGMLGAAIGIIAASGLVATVFRDDVVASLMSFLPLLAVGLVIGAPITMLAASRSSDPVYRRADRVMASYVEVWRAGWCALLSIPALLLVLTVYSDSSHFGAGVAAVFVFALAAGSVRAATLAAFAAYSGTATSPRVIPTLIGGAIGATVSGLGVVVIDASLDQRSTACIAGWMFLLPAWFGLALAFAELESHTQSTATSGETRGKLRLLITAFSAVAIVAVAAVIYRAPDQASRRFKLHRFRADETDSVSVVPSKQLTLPVVGQRVDSAPALLKFVVDTSRARSDQGRAAGKWFEAGLAEPAGDRFQDAQYKRLILRDNTGKIVSQYFDTYSDSLRPGTYYLVVGTHDDPTLDTYAKELEHRVKGALTRPANDKRLAFPLLLTLRQTNISPTIHRDSVNSISYLAGTLAKSQADSAEALVADSIESHREAPANLERANRYVNQSLESFRLVWDHDSTNVSWSDLNHQCWAATLVGQASRAITFCEAAVRQNANRYDLDSRGLARALTGNVSGAIADFQLYADSSSTTPAGALRQQWIEELKRGGQLHIADVRQRLSVTP